MSKAEVNRRCLRWNLVYYPGFGTFEGRFTEGAVMETLKDGFWDEKMIFENNGKRYVVCATGGIHELREI